MTMRPFFNFLGFMFFFMFLFLNNSTQVFSQSTYAGNTSKNTIYIEGAGAGGYGSINYERLFFYPANHLPPIQK